MSDLPNILRFRSGGASLDNPQLEWTEGGLLYRMRASISGDGVTVTREQVHIDGFMELYFSELVSLDALCRHWVEARDSWAAVRSTESGGCAVYLYYPPRAGATPRVIDQFRYETWRGVDAIVLQTLPRPVPISTGIVKSAEMWRVDVESADATGEPIGAVYDIGDILQAKAGRFHLTLERPGETEPLLSRSRLHIERGTEDFIAALCRMRRP